MSRDVRPEPEPDDPRPEPQGRVGPTGPGPLVVLGLLGLVVGWAARGQAIRMDLATPSVSWLAVGVTWFIAIVTASIAALTWRAVQRGREPLTPQQGLARLVLGKTIDRLGALAFGGFLGAAISTLGVAGESADRLFLRALVAGLGAAGAIAAGLLLEHACRVPKSPGADLP